MVKQAYMKTMEVLFAIIVTSIFVVLLIPMRDVSEELFKEGYKSSPVLSPESRAQLLKANDPFYHSLAQRYLPDKNKSFFSDLSVYSEEDWCGYTLTKDDTCCIHAYLAKNYDYIFCHLIFLKVNIEYYINKKK